MEITKELPTAQERTERPPTPTREELVEHIRVKMNQRIAADIRIIMNQFSTVSAFLEANVAELQKANRLARPSGRRDLGPKFFIAHGECVSFTAQRRFERKREMEREDRDFISNELRERRENPRFTLAQLQSIVSFMQLCSIAEIDLKGAVEYFRVMKVGITAAGDAPGRMEPVREERDVR